jgi:hypothetical protein
LPVEPIISLDDFRTLFVQELVAAIGAEKLDLLAPKFLIVAIKFTFALRTGHPENFGHTFFPWVSGRAKYVKLATKSEIPLSSPFVKGGVGI